MHDFLNIWPTVLLISTPAAKSSQRVLFTKWNTILTDLPGELRAFWQCQRDEAGTDFNKLKKKAETENKGRGNVAIWHRGTHLKTRNCKWRQTKTKGIWRKRLKLIKWSNIDLTPLNFNLSNNNWFIHLSNLTVTCTVLANSRYLNCSCRLNNMPYSKNLKILVWGG